MAKSIIFRQANSLHELKALLKLRYKGYLNSSCSGLITHNRYQIDLDAYDLRALHFGIFETDGLRANPIGCVRFIQDEITPSAPLLWQLAFTHPDLLPILNEAPKYPYPLMEYHPNKDALQYQIMEAKEKGEKILEASRFVFDPDVRASGILGFTIEATLATIFFGLNYDKMMLACVQSHSRYYQKVGFEYLDSNLRAKYQDIPARFMVNSPQSLPNRLKKKLITMGCQFDQYGGVRSSFMSSMIAKKQKQLIKAA